MGVLSPPSFWAEKKAGDLFQISCSVCRYVGGGYLIVKVRGKLTDVKLTNWKLSKRIVPVFHSIAIHIIECNGSRTYRQNNRKRFIAVNVKHLNCVAVIYFKLCYLLLIHRNKCSLIISFYGVLGNSSLNPRKGFHPHGKKYPKERPGRLT